MNKLKKTLLVTTSLLALSATSANAVDVTLGNGDVNLKLNAYAHFQAGIRNQTKLKGDDKNLSSHRKGFAFYNDTAFTAEMYKELEDVKYGARIVLVPTSKRKGGASYNGSHVYIESSFGRVEMGAPISPAAKMSETAGSITAGSGNWGNYANLDSSYMNHGKKSGIDFAKSADFFLGDKLGTNLDSKSYSSEPPRSISYYTPKFELTDTTKVQIGVGYTPDSSNTAADKISKDANQCDVKDVSDYRFTIPGIAGQIDSLKIDRTVKDAIGYGITLEQNISDGVDLKLAFTGEYAKSAGKATALIKTPTATDPSKTTTVKTYELKDLNTFNIGAILNVGNYSVAGSYGSLGKSLTSKIYHTTGQKTEYYTAGLAYKQGPFKVSADYFKSYQFKNTVDAVTLGTSYQLAPGLQTYAEITHFTAKGRPEFDPRNDFKKRTTQGTVGLIGAKLSL